MSEPIVCMSFICDSYTEACNVSDILREWYRHDFITAVTGRVLSVGVVEQVDMESAVKHAYEFLRHGGSHPDD